MSEPEATPAGETPSDAPAAPAFDPSVIRGLQVFAPVAGAAADGLDEVARKEAIVQTLAARAARLAEAVDDSLTLASDGTIRWLGDPIGKLIVGVGSLEPGATLLADEALPPEGREAAQRRLTLWLTAHLNKVLAPLIALADAQGAPEAARSVAIKVSQALGVLERERVKAEVKALDQEARGALRKLGVRFGAPNCGRWPSRGSIRTAPSGCCILPLRGARPSPSSRQSRRNTAVSPVSACVAIGRCGSTSSNDCPI
jgi:hypothetical protein